MQPWLYALVFIALMMAIGWAVDRHNSRLRRTLIRRPATAHDGRTPVFGRAPGSGTKPQPRRP